MALTRNAIVVPAIATPTAFPKPATTLLANRLPCPGPVVLAGRFVPDSSGSVRSSGSPPDGMDAFPILLSVLIG
ncbi:hypothetical protein ACWEJZ_15570 [Streptomyces bacillaris]|uniref:hypothetical protein n=1 Tax=Streptomyces sp. S8 TaxID=1837283 RepID=UPI00131BCAA0|nr:hypothetical protein [Streptomyces sp. S8]